jgi:hypothetical protein
MRILYTPWRAAFIVALLLVIFAALAILWLHYRRYLKGPARGKRIPGPPQLPLLGNILDLAPHTRNVLDILLPWTQKYVRSTIVGISMLSSACSHSLQGRLFKMCVIQLDQPVLLMSDPAILKHVLVTGFQEGRYGKGKNFRDQYAVRRPSRSTQLRAAENTQPHRPVMCSICNSGYFWPGYLQFERSAVVSSQRGGFGYCVRSACQLFLSKPSY